MNHADMMELLRRTNHYITLLRRRVYRPSAGTTNEELNAAGSRCVPYLDAVLNGKPLPNPPLISPLTPQQRVALLADFKQWSGGFSPAEVEPESIMTYIETSADDRLDRDAVRSFLIVECRQTA